MIDVGITAVIAAGSTPGVGSLIVRVLFIVGMAEGVKAIREIEAAQLDQEGPYR